MKAAIIGGGGRVGANAAFALQMAGDVREILLVDVAREAAEGEALDLRHGASLTFPQKIRAGGLAEAADCDLIIHCAGLRRKPEESRLDLINRNVGLFRNLLEEINRAGWKEQALFLVVANPVDILTYLANKYCPLPPERIIGLGTLVDTARFRSFIGEHFDVDQTQVAATILGEHGDSMVPLWSTATVNGFPLSWLPGYSAETEKEIFSRTKTSGADVIRLKGGAGYCVGLAIAELVRAIVKDQHSLLPVSLLQQGALGINDVCLSLPTIVGRTGALKIIEPAATLPEKDGLIASAKVLKATLSNLKL
jgi:L-lactate dehydrogenase